MDKKKLVLPGEHLYSCEEAEPGENTYVDNDEIFSAGVGEINVSTGAVVINTKSKPRVNLHVGMYLYCMVMKTSPNKAIVSCIPADPGVSGRSGITGILSVAALGKRGYVRDLRSEVKIGDIIKAKVRNIGDTGDAEITLDDQNCGFLAVFCPHCRKQMNLNGQIFICNDCDWKENRKIPKNNG